MIGGGVVYTVSEVAARHGVSVKRETTDPAEAYEDLPRSERIKYRPGLLPDISR